MGGEKKAQQTACVVGVTGFIGRAAATALLRAGFKVRGTVRRLQREDAAALDDGIEQVLLDVTDPVSSIAEAMSGCDVVVNCAGIYRW